MSSRADTFDQMMLIVTLGTILGSVGANILFRKIAVSGLARRIEVSILVGLIWLVWTMLAVMAYKSLALSPSKMWSTYVKRLMVNMTYMLTVFAYLYLDDFIRNTSLADMTLAESILMTFGGLLFIAALQTLFEYFAVFEATRPDRTKQH
jgi:hypothetical protein